MPLNVPMGVDITVEQGNALAFAIAEFEATISTLERAGFEAAGSVSIDLDGRRIGIITP